MVNSCSAYNCTSRAVPDCKLSFHRFPFNRPELLQQWICAVRRKNWQPTQYSRLCCRHFAEEDFYDPNERQCLKKDAVPTVFDYDAKQAKKIKLNEQNHQLSDHSSSQGDDDTNDVSDVSNSDAVMNIKEERGEGENGDTENGDAMNDVSQEAVDEEQSSCEEDSSDVSMKEIDIYELLVSFKNAIVDRLDIIEQRLGTLTSTCITLEKQTNHIWDALNNRTTVPALMDESSSSSNHSETHSMSPTSTSQSTVVRKFGSTKLKLNSKEDFPGGSWLGNEKKPEMRVRCCLSPSALAYVNTTCRTPKKMALTLVSLLFDPNSSSPNLEGQLEDQTGLDPLLMFGIQCHLMSMFRITKEDWKELRQLIYAKCGETINKQREDMFFREQESFEDNIKADEKGKFSRIGGAQLEFISNHSAEKNYHSEVTDSSCTSDSSDKALNSQD